MLWISSIKILEWQQLCNIYRLRIFGNQWSILSPTTCLQLWLMKFILFRLKTFECGRLLAQTNSLSECLRAISKWTQTLLAWFLLNQYAKTWILHGLVSRKVFANSRTVQTPCSFTNSSKMAQHQLISSPKTALWD